MFPALARRPHAHRTVLPPVLLSSHTTASRYCHLGAGWLSARRIQECSAPHDAANFAPYFSKTNGLIDFAGSGVVHMLGGGAGARRNALLRA